MIVSFSDKVNDCHVAEVYHRERQDDLARHGHNARHQFSPGMDRIPAAQHQGCITKIQQVITGKQHTVDEPGKLHVVVQQCQYKNMSIAVKNESHPDSNDVSNKQVKDVSDGVHTSRFCVIGIGTFADTKLLNHSKLSNISESLFCTTAYYYSKATIRRDVERGWYGTGDLPGPGTKRGAQSFECGVTVLTYVPR